MVGIRSKHYNWVKVNHAEDFSDDDIALFNEAFGYEALIPYSETSVWQAGSGNPYAGLAEGFQFFRIEHGSLVRPYPGFFLYNKPKALGYELLHKNGPIYTANDSANLREYLKPGSRKAEARCKDYIRFFFDHVAGSHGYFYICETYKEISEALTRFYRRYGNADEKARRFRHMDSLITKGMILAARHFVDEYFINASAKDFFRMQSLPSYDRNGKQFSVNAWMVFKNDLFNANVHIDLESRSCNISIDNELQWFDSSHFSDSQLQRSIDRIEFREGLPTFEMLYKIIK